MRKKLAIILQHATFENFNLAATLSATQAALKGETHLFLSHEALFFFIRAPMETLSVGFKSQEYCLLYDQFRREEKIPHPLSLFAHARSLGLLHVYGCSETAKLLKISSLETQKFKALIGFATFLDIASDSQMLAL